MLGEGFTVTLTGLVLVAAVAGSGRVGEWRHDGFDLADARRFDAYPLYHAGDRVEGVPLVAVSHRDDSAEYVSFVYGDCTAASDSGCAPPVEIQVWPVCRRNLALYDGAEAETELGDNAVVRGVRAAVFEDGARLELQTGRATVVVFGQTRAAAWRIAQALRSLDGSVRADEALPQPQREEGAMSC